MENEQVLLSGNYGDDKWSGIIRVNANPDLKDPLLELDYFPASGETESIKITH